MLTEQCYREALENVASYNSRLCTERRQRLPFIDSQTGVAQNHTNLWIPYRYRGPGRRHGQIYSYPAQRWKKKSSLPLPDIPMPHAKSADAELPESDVNPVTTVDNAVTSVDSDSKDMDESTSGATSFGTSGAPVHRDEYDWEHLSEPPDAGEIDQRNSDSSDFEETYIKRKTRRKDKKRPAVGGSSSSVSTSVARGRKKDREVEPTAERDKPFSCEAVSKRAAAVALTMTSASSSASTKTVNASKYCDFCLGDELENKKTGKCEEMVSCADCGRCGHPSCLQFTPNMIISVKKYPWQCIECKSCGICGTSDNDDQLLFCDDCDRGYHMYCLSPPLSEPPEGSWSCHLCIEEFYGGHKPEVLSADGSEADS